MEQFIVELVISLVSKYPIVSAILGVIGFMRLIFKPAMSFLRTVVSSTASVKDDEVLNKVEASKVFLAFAWFIDFFASIKLPGYDIKK